MTRIYKTAFAATGDKEALADTDPGTGKVSLPTGWTADYEKDDLDPNYRPVGRKEMNGVINELTESLGEIQQFGFVAWQSLSGGWPAKATVWHADVLWMSTAANNTTTPGAVGANWMRLTLQGVPGATFSEVDALTEDQGPIIVTDMDGTAWTWVNTPYFTGYRSKQCGKWDDGWTPTPLPFHLLATGGVWSESDPKHKRVIARYRESGLVVPIGDWTKGPNMIADLGSGDWKAPDLQDLFKRMAGTDVDTANARTVGSYQADALQNITGTISGVVHVATNAHSGALYPIIETQSVNAALGTQSNTNTHVLDASIVARTSTETRSASSAVMPVIHI